MGKIKTYCLDRFSDFKIISAPSESISVNIREKFKYAYGIFTSDKEPMALRIAVENKKTHTGDLLKASPLHSSQEIIHENEREITFQLKILNTLDFHRRIMSFGKDIRVLEPKSYAETIKEELKIALEHY